MSGVNFSEQNQIFQAPTKQTKKNQPKSSLVLASNLMGDKVLSISVLSKQQKFETLFLEKVSFFPN